MKDLELAIKQLIIEVLNLEDITPANIDNDAKLFSADGLGLDSIDALEIGVAIKKRYNITINSDDPAIRKHFETISNLAKFIATNRR